MPSPKSMMSMGVGTSLGVTKKKWNDKSHSEVIHLDCDDMTSSLLKEKEKQILSNLMNTETQALLQSSLKLSSKERQESASPDPVTTEKIMEEVMFDLNEVGEDIDEYFGDIGEDTSTATNRGMLLDESENGQEIKKVEPAINPSPPKANCSRAQLFTGSDWQPSGNSHFKPSPVKDTEWNVGRSSMWTPKSLDQSKPADPGAKITSGNSSWKIETPYITRKPDLETFLMDSSVKKNAALLATSIITPGLHHGGRSTTEELSAFQPLLKTVMGNSASGKEVFGEPMLSNLTKNTAGKKEYGECSKNSNKNSENSVQIILIEDSSSDSDVDTQCSKKKRPILDEKEDSVETIEILRDKIEYISKKIEYLQEEKYKLKEQKENIIKNHKGDNKRDLQEETDCLIDEIGKQIGNLKNMLHENRMKILKESSGGIGKALHFFQRSVKSPEYNDDGIFRSSEGRHGDSSSRELPPKYSKSVEHSQRKSSSPSQKERHRKSSRSFTKYARSPKRSRDEASSSKSSRRRSKSPLSSKMKRPLSPAPIPIPLKIDGQHWSRSHILGTLKKFKHDLLSKNINANKANIKYAVGRAHDVSITGTGSAESSSQLPANMKRKTPIKNVYNTAECSLRGLDSEERESTNIKQASVNKSKRPIQYVDLGMHWCRLCDVVCDAIPSYYKHLLSPAHLALLKNDGKPWLAKTPPTFQKPVAGGSNSITLPVVGSEFYHSLSVVYCSLCDKFLRDMRESMKHIESDTHTANFKTYNALNPAKYEAYKRAHSSALSRYNCNEEKRKRKNSIENSFQVEQRLLKKCKHIREKAARQIKNGHSGSIENHSSKVDEGEKQAKGTSQLLQEEEDSKSDEESSGESVDEDSGEDYMKSIKMRKAFNMFASKRFQEKERTINPPKTYVKSPHEAGDNKSGDKMRESKSQLEMEPSNLDKTRENKSTVKIPLVGKIPFFKKKGAVNNAKTLHKSQSIKETVVSQLASEKNTEAAEALSESKTDNFGKNKDIDPAINEIENYLKKSDRMNVEELPQDDKSGEAGVLGKSNEMDDRESERFDGIKTSNNEKFSLTNVEVETKCKSPEALLGDEKQNEMIEVLTEDPALATLEALQLLNLPLPGLELTTKCSSASSSNVSAKSEESNSKELGQIQMTSSGHVSKLEEEISDHSPSKYSSHKQSDCFIFYPADAHSLDVSSPYELGSHDSVPDFTFCKREDTPPPPGTKNTVLETICVKDESHSDHVDRLTPPPPGTETTMVGKELNYGAGLQMQCTFNIEPPNLKQISVSDEDLLKNKSCAKRRMSLTTEGEVQTKQKYPKHKKLGSGQMVSEKPEIDKNVVKSCGVELVTGKIGQIVIKEKTEDIHENTNRIEGNKFLAVIENYDYSAVQKECNANNISQDTEDFEVTECIAESSFEHQTEKCQAIEFKAFHVKATTGICNKITNNLIERVYSNDSLTSIDSENICPPSVDGTSLKQAEFTFDSSEDDLPSLCDSPSRIIDEVDVQEDENEATDTEKSDEIQAKQEKDFELKIHRITRSEIGINAKAFVNNPALDMKDMTDEDLSHSEKNASARTKTGGMQMSEEEESPNRRSLRAAMSICGRKKEAETFFLSAHSNDAQKTPVKKNCGVNPQEPQEVSPGMSTPRRSSRIAAFAANLAMAAQIYKEPEMIHQPILKRQCIEENGALHDSSVNFGSSNAKPTHEAF